MKKLITIITVFCFVMVSFTGTVYAQLNNSMPPLSLQILGKKILSEAPILQDDVIYLPFRIVSQYLDYEVYWDSSSQTMQISKADNIVRITVNNILAYVNNKKVELENTPILYNGRAYIPLELAETCYNNYSVSFDEQNNIVKIDNRKTDSQDENDNNTIFINDSIIDNVSTIIKDSIVFVPVRAVSEALGYEVHWYPKKNTIELIKGTAQIDIVIDTKTINVNGKENTTEAEAFLKNGRAYAPLSFVKNILNCDTYFDNSNKILKISNKPSNNKNNTSGIANINEVVIDEDSSAPIIKIIGDSEYEYSTLTLSNPDRFVIDIKNAVLNTNTDSITVDKGNVKGVRISQFAVKPQKVVRVVIDLKSAQGCDIVQSDDKKSLSLVYTNTISSITAAKEGNSDVVTITGNVELQSSIMMLTNPARIVFDIKGADFENPEQTIDASALDASLSFVQAIRTGQFDSDTARVVMDINQDETIYYIDKSYGNSVKIYISDTPFDFFQYTKNFKSAYLNLNLGSQVEYKADFDKENNILSIILPKKMDSSDTLGKYLLSDNLLEYVDVIEEKVNNDVQTVIKCKIKDLVTFELLSPTTTSIVQLKFKYAPQRFEDLTIIIDAGHGGKDPGAKAADGMVEKDFNLDVALRLNEILKAIGFNTIMTRTDDTFIELSDRTNIANSNYADFFMSIHFNAFNSTAKGIETLYYPNAPTDADTVDNKSVAQIFHKELINSLKLTSRGITPRPNLYVLHRTKMPAILAELGFITNPDELLKIETEEYRETAAKALAVSIITYFKDMQNVNTGFDIQSIYDDTYKNANNTTIDTAQASN